MKSNAFVFDLEVRQCAHHNDEALKHVGWPSHDFVGIIPILLVPLSLRKQAQISTHGGSTISYLQMFQSHWGGQ